MCAGTSGRPNIGHNTCALATVTEMYFKMATTFNPGGHSPTSLSRTLEKVIDEAQFTGELNLNGRKLKDYPKVASKYDLTDTSSAGE